MRNYEMIFIVRPDVADDEVQKLITQMEGVVASAGGKVEKVEKMGRRRLAYRVHKTARGLLRSLLRAGHRRHGQGV